MYCRRYVIGLLALLFSCLIACDVVSVSTEGAGSGATGVSPGTMLYGRLTVVPVMAVLKAEDRPYLLALKDVLTERGIEITDGGELLVWPGTPGSQWRVKLDSDVLQTDADGNFSVTVPASGAATLRLCHPTDDNYAEVVVPLSSLSSNSQSPRQLGLVMLFKGPCGMGDNDAEDFCGGVAQRYTPPQYQPGQTGPTQQFWGIRTMRLGTYPPPEEHIAAVQGLTCPRYDGTLTKDDIPPAVLALLERLHFDSSALDNELAYVGSTCDLAVLDGTCPNENPLSDVEYDAFIRELMGESAVIPLDPDAARGPILGILHAKSATIKALGGDTGNFGGPEDVLLLTPPGVSGLNTSCLKNHKGRMCGMFLAGDLSLDIGEVIKKGQRGHIIVSPGQMGTFTVHNNGVFGTTSVKVLKDDLGTDLTSPNFSTKNGLHIEHYDSHPSDHQRPYRYFADREISFRIPETATQGQSTLFSFTVDDSTVELEFVVSQFSIVPDSVELGPTDSQLFQVQFVGEMPADATFQWTLQNNTGSLVTPGEDTSQISYTPNVGATGTDVLQVEVSVPGAGGRTVLGTAQAQIRLRDGTITVDPDSASLTRGSSQVFSVALNPVPNGVITYQWRLANNTGTLTTTAGSLTTYRASNTLDVPATDTLEVTVLVDDGSGTSREYGRAHANIEITAGSASILPGSAQMYTGTPEGETRGFTTAVSGDTGGFNLLYQWESVHGYGTVNQPDLQAIAYTVNPGLQPPLMDELKVTVFLDDPGTGPRQFATATIPITINKKIYYVENITDVKIIDGRYYIGTWFVAPMEATAIRTTITVIEHVPAFIPSFVGTSHSWTPTSTDSIVDGNYVLVTAGSSGNANNAAAVQAYHEAIQGRARVTVEY